jgi:hypothetical protein
MESITEVWRFAVPSLGFALLWGLIDRARGRRSPAVLVTVALALVAAAVDLGFIQGRLAPRTDWNLKPILEFTWGAPAFWLACGAAGAVVARSLSAPGSGPPRRPADDRPDGGAGRSEPSR